MGAPRSIGVCVSLGRARRPKVIVLKVRNHGTLVMLSFRETGMCSKEHQRRSTLCFKKMTRGQRGQKPTKRSETGIEPGSRDPELNVIGRSVMVSTSWSRQAYAAINIPPNMCSQQKPNKHTIFENAQTFEYMSSIVGSFCNFYRALEV